MPAGAAAADADAVRIDVEVLGIQTDVSHGPADVGHRFGHLELRRAAVADDEQRVAVIDQFAELLEADRALSV